MTPSPERATIRPAAPAEADRLTAVALDAKRHWDYPEAWIDAWRQELTVTSEYVAAHPVLVAEVGGEVAGFVAFEDRGDHWSLDHLWVDPPHIGNGLGRLLVEEGFRRVVAKRPAPVRLESDPYAVGFYERLGARVIGEVPAPVLGQTRSLPLMEFS